MLKVAIVGTAETSRDQAPFKDTEWEIWGSSKPQNFPRWTRWFELHDMLFVQNRLIDVWPWAVLQPPPEKPHGAGTIYMQEQTPLVPASVRFPREDLIAAFGPDHWSSGPAWMMGRAIYEMCLSAAGVLGTTGEGRIALFGIEMAVGQEYESQRAGMKHWIRVARERGIKVDTPTGCSLAARDAWYAFETDSELEMRVDNELKRALAKQRDLDERMEVLERDRWMLQGAINCLKSIDKVWVPNRSPNTDLLAKYRHLADAKGIDAK